MSHSCYVLTNLQAILVLSSPTFRSFVYFPDLPVDHYCDFLTYLKVIIVVSWPTWRSLLWFPDLPVGRCSWGHIAAWPGSTARDLQEFVFTKQVDPTVLCSAHLKLFRFILSIFKSGSGSAKKPGSKTQLFFPGSRYWHGPHGPVSSACGFFCWIVHGRWPPTAPTSICMNCCGPNCFALVKIRDQISNLEWPLLKVSYSLSSCLLLSIVIHCWYSFAD